MSISLLHDDSQAKISKVGTGKEDQISDLPDDILVRIISSLTLKQAGSTSVLSKRWRHLWAYVPNLNFDASAELLDELRTEGIESRKEKLFVEESKYSCWVDQVVNSYKSRTIDEFRVRFNFRTKRYRHFDRWLGFAMEKRVKRLEFNILASWVGRDLLSYNLPSLSPWSPLTSLELAHVNVTGEVLQKFLADCPNLELLSVSLSHSLEDLKVRSLKLKSLKLAHCDRVDHLEISAPNLISCYYYGQAINWSLKDAPNVTELFLGSDHGMNLFFDYSVLSSCMPQLELFTLTGTGEFEITQDFPKVFPVASRLKMLHIGFHPRTAEELFFLNYLIKSFPLLHKFELRDSVRNIIFGVVMNISPALMCIVGNMKMTEETREAEVFPHGKLKILEIRGFTGSEAELGFAMHLIRTFVSVEKITIKVDDFELESMLIAKEAAQRLYAVVKPGIALEILWPLK